MGGPIALPGSDQVSATIQLISDWHRMPSHATNGVADAGRAAVAEAAEGMGTEKAHRRAFRKVEKSALANRLTEDELVWRATAVIQRHEHTLESLSFCVEAMAFELATLELAQGELQATHDGIVADASAIEL